MKNTNTLSLLLIAFLLFSCNANDDNTSNTPNLGNAPENPNKTLLLALINDIRMNGCQCGNTAMPAVAEVSWNQQLALAAEKHSEYMNQTNQLTHTGDNMSTAMDRIEAVGYSLSSGSWAENLAKGYADENSVFISWKDSEGHCKNMMKATVMELGVGTDGPYWTMVLAGQ